MTAEAERFSFGVAKSVVSEIGWKEIIPRYYGPSMYLSNETEKSLILGAKLPVLIKDSKSGDKTLKFFVFDKLAEISVHARDNSFVIDSPSASELATRAEGAVAAEYKRVEKLVLSACRSEMLKIAVVRTVLTPFYQLLRQLRSDNELKADSVDDIVRRKGSGKSNMYLDVLRSMGMIRESNIPGRYTEGNFLVAMQQGKGSDDLGHMVGAILAEKYRYLTSTMKLWALMPYVRMSTACYTPAYYMREPVRLSLDELNVSHRIIYEQNIAGIRSNLVLKERIGEMVDAEIISRETNGNDGYFSGTEQVLRNMLASPIA